MTRYVVTTLVALFAVGCGKGSVAGTYVLDQAAMSTSLDQKVAAMPKEKQGLGKLAAELVKKMDIRLTLQAGGTGEMQTSMPDILGKGEPQRKTEAITWELAGDVVRISGGKKPVQCSLKGKQLRCSAGKDEMIFVKS